MLYYYNFPIKTNPALTNEEKDSHHDWMVGYIISPIKSNPDLTIKENIYIMVEQ